MRRFDHHCDIYGTCIADANPRWYVLVPFCGTLACVIGFVGMILKLVYPAQWRSASTAGSIPRWDVPMTIVMTVAFGFLGAHLSFLGFDQFRNHYVKNMTMKRHQILGVNLPYRPGWHGPSVRRAWFGIPLRVRPGNPRDARGRLSFPADSELMVSDGDMLAEGETWPEKEIKKKMEGGAKGKGGPTPGWEMATRSDHV